VLELIRIPVSTLPNVTVDNERLKTAVYAIMTKLLGINEDLLDFFAFLFAPSKSEIYSPARKGELLISSQKDEILKKVSNYIDVPYGYLKLIFKLGFDDKEPLSSEHIYEFQEAFNSADPILNGLLNFSLNLYSLFTTKNLTKRLVKTSSKFGIDPKSAECLINITSHHEFSPSRLEEQVGTGILGAVGKQLRISKKEVSGLISLCMGDLSNPSIETLMRVMFARNNLPLSLISLVKALLALFTSKETEELLNAADILKLNEKMWILLGKKLIHPRNIPETYFTSLGIKAEDPLLEQRNYQDMKTELFSSWMHNIIKTLEFSEEDRKDKRERDGRYGSEAEIEPLSGDKHDSDRKLWFSKEEKKEDGKDDSMDKTSEVKFPTHGKGERTLEDIERKKRKELVIKLLTIEEQQLIIPLLAGLMRTFNETSNAPPLNEADLETIIKFLTVRDIILHRSKNLIQNACFNLASLMGFDGQILSYLVDITMSSNPFEVKTAIRNILKVRGRADDLGVDKKIAEFGKFASQEFAAYTTSQETARTLAAYLKVPEFLVVKVLAPSLPYKLTIDEICHIFDLAGFHEGVFKRDKIHIEDSRGQIIPIGEFRYLLANLGVGHVTDYERVLELFNLRASTGKIIEAITTPRPRVMISILREFLTPLLQTKLKIPPQIFEIAMALVRN